MALVITIFHIELHAFSPIAWLALRLRINPLKLYKFNIQFNIVFFSYLKSVQNTENTEIPDKDPSVNEDDFNSDELPPVKEDDQTKENKTKKNAGKMQSPPLDPGVPPEFRDVFSDIVKGFLHHMTGRHN